MCQACFGIGRIEYENLFGHQEYQCKHCAGTGGKQATPEWIEYELEYNRVLAIRLELLSKIDQDSPTESCIVLDPFAGTATAGMVATKYGRKFVGVELNPQYIQLAKGRTSKIQLALTT